MRRIAIVCAAGITVLLLLIAAATGGAATERVKLQLTLKAKTLNLIDTGPTGDSPGDLVTGTDTVFRRGRAIGRAHSHCVAIAGTTAAGRLDCTNTLTLPGGRIVSQQEVIYKGETLTAVGAITGGTGIYAKARGDLTLRARNLEVGTVVLHLTR